MLSAIAYDSLKIFFALIYTVYMYIYSRMTVAETTTATTIPTTVRSAMTTSAVTGCGMSIGCFRDPPDCMPSSSGCRFLSWLYVSECFTLRYCSHYVCVCIAGKADWLKKLDIHKFVSLSKSTEMQCCQLLAKL